jgi:hypothetical protein
MGSEEDDVTIRVPDDDFSRAVERRSLGHDARAAVERGADGREVVDFDVKHRPMRALGDGGDVLLHGGAALQHQLDRAAPKDDEAELVSLGDLDGLLKSEPVDPKPQGRFDARHDEVGGELVHARAVAHRRANGLEKWNLPMPVPRAG